MKILNISANDEMGSRFNGFDIHDALLSRGHDATLGCFWNHTSEKDWVFNIFPGTIRRLEAEVVRGIEVSTGYQSTLQWWSKGLIKSPEFLKADVVHLQVIHDHFFKMETIADVVRVKPTIWTWHDLWPVTGHCIFPVNCNRWDKGCGSCPDLLSPLPVFRDRTSEEYLRKVNFLASLEIDVHITTEWMRKQLEPHLSKSKVKLHVFPFGIDLDRFSPGGKDEIRSKLGLSDETFCVFARATDDERKGFKYLVSALDKLSHKYDITLITTQATGLTEKWSENLKVIEFPWTNDPDNLIELYAASDLFAMPSVGESFGMMALEAMACGKPVLTVRGTATAEVVGCPELELDPSKLSHDLEVTISNLIEDRVYTAELGRKARSRASEKFSMKMYLDNLTALYEKVVNEKTK